MTLSAGEQYLLELINRARLDPQAEAKRYNLALNDDLDPGTITGDALQVLAPNADLNAAATAHSEWMLSTNTFSHTGQNGSSAGDRMETAGYEFTGTWTWRENLAWAGTTGTIDLDAAIENHHEGLYRSSGHRANTFAANIAEVGLGQVEGMFTQNGTSYSSSMLTENFAASGGATFVTGVAYQDTNNDKFYSIGEGRSSYSVTADGQSATTSSAGGYGVDVGDSAQTEIVVSRGSTSIARLDLDMSQGNVKLDVVIDANGETSLDLSGSARLLGGIQNARLLGVADLSLDGSGRDNRLTGNKGDNEISGHNGDDRLYGNRGRDDIRGGSGEDVLFGGWGSDEMRGNVGDDKLFGGRGSDRIIGGGGNDELQGQNGSDRLYGERGNDRLFGGNGNDVIKGGADNDRMTGGAGADVFVFNDGDDVIRDFEDNIDTIKIDRGMAGGDATIASILDDATVHNGHTTLHFEGGDSLTFYHMGDPDDLANDLLIV